MKLIALIFLTDYVYVIILFNPYNLDLYTMIHYSESTRG